MLAHPSDHKSQHGDLHAPSSEDDSVLMHPIDRRSLTDSSSPDQALTSLAKPSTVLPSHTPHVLVGQLFYAQPVPCPILGYVPDQADPPAGLTTVDLEAARFPNNPAPINDGRSIAGPSTLAPSSLQQLSHTLHRRTGSNSWPGSDPDSRERVSMHDESSDGDDAEEDHDYHKRGHGRLSKIIGYFSRFLGWFRHPGF